MLVKHRRYHLTRPHKRDGILKLIKEIFSNVYHDVVAVCKYHRRDGGERNSFR